MIRFLIAFLLLLICSNITWAQKPITTISNTSITSPIDTSSAITAPNPDTIKMASNIHYTIPKKAGLYSALVPGLGQLYNRQYWKIGVIYAGLGVGTYFIANNLKDYKYWRKIYVGFLNNDSTSMAKEPAFNSAEQVKSVQDYYQKNLQTSVLYTGLGYILQVIDAIVFSHLKGFDISPNIGLNMRTVPMQNNTIGLGLVFNIK